MKSPFLKHNMSVQGSTTGRLASVGSGSMMEIPRTTATGRLNSSEPQMQRSPLPWPRSPEVARLRKAIIAQVPALDSMIELDLSKLEKRVSALANPH